jgi:hypothetical protein
MTTVSFGALTKNEISRLSGGRFRGAHLLFQVDVSETVRVWVFGRLRNQFQSQRQSPSHPEGWEPIMADGFPRELEYDLATGTLEVPVPALSTGGVVGLFLHACPAKVFRYNARQEAGLLRRREAGVWRARFDLLRAIRNCWADANVIGAIMSEHLSVQWRENTGEPLATRLIAYVYQLEEQTCRDLTALINVPPPALAMAA